MNNKAIALLSGGLDSSLAALLIREHGIDLQGVFVKTPFNSASSIEQASKQLGIPVMVVEADEGYFTLLKKPLFGYGRQANPCIDCHIYFLKKAREAMIRSGASFVVTGDVVGQRSMSQYPKILKRIEDEAGLSGLVVRPLSGLLLEETLPEKAGVVRRERLLDISGRTRKRQLLLAEQYHLSEYSAPSAACILTDPTFAVRVKDLVKHDDLFFDDCFLLRVGRHFRINGYRFIIGRNEQENKVLFERARQGIIVMTEDIPSPTGIFLDQQVVSCEDVLKSAAGIIVSYSDASKLDRKKIDISIVKAGQAIAVLSVPVRPKADFNVMRIG